MTIDQAVFTLIVRLQDAPLGPPQGWFDWHAADGRLDGGHQPPYKQLPAEDRHYFHPHIEELLFPEDGRRSTSPFTARWLSQPDGEELTLEGSVAGERRTFRLRVDLLERYVPPLEPRSDFGLVHLTLAGDSPPSAADVLCCNRWLRHVFRRGPTDGPQLTVPSRSPARIEGSWPIREWLSHLFGAAQPGVERMYYVAALAPEPVDLDAWSSDVEQDSHDGSSGGEVWRRALTRGNLAPAVAHRSIEQDGPRGRRPQVQLGPFSGFVLGRGCGLVCDSRQFTGAAVRNLRSYWADALLIALMQQTYLEHCARRLGALGADPSQRELDDLYEDWLAFRNVLWWSQPSDRDAPGELLLALRSDLGSADLFDDLVGDFDTYVARRQRRLDDRQAAALTNLQAFGGAGTLVAAVAGALVFAGLDGGESTATKVIVITALVALFVACLKAVQLAMRDIE